MLIETTPAKINGNHGAVIHPLYALINRLQKGGSKPSPEEVLSLMVGQSDAMNQIRDDVRIAAPRFMPVLIVGETGVGKDLVATTLHILSNRASMPFIPVNCAAFPETLLESELFGYTKGSFTGAVADKKGHFQNANGGTIFLDELHSMPIHMQVKLLRALESGEVHPIGANRSYQVDVRIIAAVNRDPRLLVSQGKLRDDLYYRICGYPIEIPRLANRKYDIPQLADYFLARFNEREGTQVTTVPELWTKLFELPLPGNIRELKNIVECAAAVAASTKTPQITKGTLSYVVSAKLGSDVIFSPEGLTEEPSVSRAFVPVSQSPPSQRASHRVDSSVEIREAAGLPADFSKWTKDDVIKALKSINPFLNAGRQGIFYGVLETYGIGYDSLKKKVDAFGIDVDVLAKTHASALLSNAQKDSDTMLDLLLKLGLEQNSDSHRLVVNFCHELEIELDAKFDDSEIMSSELPENVTPGRQSAVAEFTVLDPVDVEESEPELTPEEARVQDGLPVKFTDWDKRDLIKALSNVVEFSNGNSIEAIVARAAEEYGLSEEGLLPYMRESGIGDESFQDLVKGARKQQYINALCGSSTVEQAAKELGLEHGSELASECTELGLGSFASVKSQYLGKGFDDVEIAEYGDELESELGEPNVEVRVSSRVPSVQASPVQSLQSSAPISPSSVLGSEFRVSPVPAVVSAVVPQSVRPADKSLDAIVISDNAPKQSGLVASSQSPVLAQPSQASSVSSPSSSVSISQSEIRDLLLAAERDGRLEKLRQADLRAFRVLTLRYPKNSTDPITPLRIVGEELAKLEGKPNPINTGTVFTTENRGLGKLRDFQRARLASTIQDSGHERADSGIRVTNQDVIAPAVSGSVRIPPVTVQTPQVSEVIVTPLTQPGSVTSTESRGITKDDFLVLVSADKRNVENISRLQSALLKLNRDGKLAFLKQKHPALYEILSIRFLGDRTLTWTRSSEKFNETRAEGDKITSTTIRSSELRAFELITDSLSSSPMGVAVAPTVKPQQVKDDVQVPAAVEPAVYEPTLATHAIDNQLSIFSADMRSKENRQKLRDTLLKLKVDGKLDFVERNYSDSFDMLSMAYMGDRLLTNEECRKTLAQAGREIQIASTLNQRLKNVLTLIRAHVQYSASVPAMPVKELVDVLSDSRLSDENFIKKRIVLLRLEREGKLNFLKSNTVAYAILQLRYLNEVIIAQKNVGAELVRLGLYENSPVQTTVSSIERRAIVDIIDQISGSPVQQGENVVPELSPAPARSPATTVPSFVSPVLSTASRVFGSESGVLGTEHGMQVSKPQDVTPAQPLLTVEELTVLASNNKSDESVRLRKLMILKLKEHGLLEKLREGNPIFYEVLSLWYAIDGGKPKSATAILYILNEKQAKGEKPLELQIIYGYERAARKRLAELAKFVVVAKEQAEAPLESSSVTASPTTILSSPALTQVQSTLLDEDIRLLSLEFTNHADALLIRDVILRLDEQGKLESLKTANLRYYEILTLRYAKEKYRNFNEVLELLPKEDGRKPLTVGDLFTLEKEARKKLVNLIQSSQSVSRVSGPQLPVASMAPSLSSPAPRAVTQSSKPAVVPVPVKPAPIPVPHVYPKDASMWTKKDFAKAVESFNFFGDKSNYNAMLVHMLGKAGVTTEKLAASAAQLYALSPRDLYEFLKKERVLFVIGNSRNLSDASNTLRAALSELNDYFKKTEMGNPQLYVGLALDKGQTSGKTTANRPAPRAPVKGLPLVTERTVTSVPSTSINPSSLPSGVGYLVPSHTPLVTETIVQLNLDTGLPVNAKHWDKTHVETSLASLNIFEQGQWTATRLAEQVAPLNDLDVIALEARITGLGIDTQKLVKDAKETAILTAFSGEPQNLSDVLTQLGCTEDQLRAVCDECGFNMEFEQLPGTKAPVVEQLDEPLKEGLARAPPSVR
ncbi:MAG: sigma 54-interacting transcriptional regulator [Candidatus Micrarchaeota archaeon]|nr:sigma 54-interacting transcriptional regulator [Candidatus Micrarchaeota archaeon]